MFKTLYSYLFIEDLIKLSGGSIPIARIPLEVKLMRDTAWVMLYVYMLFVLNPVMPIVADKLAHTFWQEYHMIVVHGVYGKTHVHAELDEAQKQSDKNKTSKFGSEESTHLIFNTVTDFSHSYFVVSHYTPYKLHSLFSFPRIYYQPPKFNKVILESVVARPIS